MVAVPEWVKDIRFKQIVTHAQPHLDEITGIWLLQEQPQGGTLFPGIEEAEIVFWTTGQAPDGRTADDYLREGTVLVGIGGGLFDEHPVGGGQRKHGESAASLVLKGLGLEEDESLKRIVKFVTDGDTRLAGTPFDLQALVKAMNATYPDDSMKVVNWTKEILRAVQFGQCRFHEDGRREFEARAKVVEFQEGGAPVLDLRGKPLRVAYIETDNPEVQKFARSAHGGKVSMVVLRGEGGNVKILSSQMPASSRLRDKATPGDIIRVLPKIFSVSRTMPLRDALAGIEGVLLESRPAVEGVGDLVQILRAEEQRRRGQRVPPENNLLEEGDMSADPKKIWHYFPEAGMILNGSFSHPDVEPTMIPWEKFPEFVGIALSPKNFEPSRESGCRRGICGGTACSWFKWQLPRCCEVRGEHVPSGVPRDDAGSRSRSDHRDRSRDDRRGGYRGPQRVPARPPQDQSHTR